MQEKNKPFRITQSFIKAMRDYKSGDECGLIVKHQYVDMLPYERDSKAMALGCYLEWLLTETLLGAGKGSLPKNRQIPRAEYYVKSLKAVPQGKKPWDLNELGHPILGEKDMLVDYRRIHDNVKRIIVCFDKMGLKMIRAGKKYTKGKHEGTIDLVCECTKGIKFSNGIIWKIGDHIVLDLKYSSLLYNKWDKMGWQLSESDLQKQYHGTQALQYHYITGLPFYFFVISSGKKKGEEKDDGEEENQSQLDIKFFHIKISDEALERHLIEANYLEKEFNFDKEIGFVARPSYKRCNNCQLKETCTFKHEFPQPETIEL